MHTKLWLTHVATAGFIVLWMVALALLVGRVRTAFKRRDAARGMSYEEPTSGDDSIATQGSPFATALILAGLMVTFGFISVRLVPFLPRPLIPIVANASRLALSGSIFLSWLNMTTTSYWTRHYYLNKRGTLNGEVEEVTSDTLAHLAALLRP